MTDPRIEPVARALCQMRGASGGMCVHRYLLDERGYCSNGRLAAEIALMAAALAERVAEIARVAGGGE